MTSSGGQDDQRGAPDERAPQPRRIVRQGFIAVQAAVVLGVVLVACSTRPDGSPVAVVPVSTSTATVATTTLVPATTTTEADVTTAAFTTAAFSTAVMPVLEANCASCHTSGGPGAAHMSLATAGDARENAEIIGLATAVGYMPPWPAADGDVVFHDDRRLGDAERESIQTWARALGVIDIDASTPLVPTRQVVPPLERDAVMVGEPYQGSTAEIDDYRCQIYDPKLTEAAFLQGYGIEADRTEVVHHALLFRAEAATRTAAEEADAADPAVGWSCSGLAGFGGRAGEVKQIMSWAPGQAPTTLPADTGIAMGAGDFFVAQIHYHYTDEWADLPPDRSMIVVDYASDGVIAAAGGALDPIQLTLYLGPAEIPCSTTETGPLCDRDAAIARLLEVEGGFSAFVANALMGQCGASLADFAGMTGGIATSRCDLPATPGQIVSLWGHMHEIGTSFRMTLNPGTPGERVLLDIPKWDFDWQLDYEPVEDIVLVATDVIRVECAWDRSLIDDDAEPRYIVWAEGTDDEMCYSQIVTRPTP